MNDIILAQIDKALAAKADRMALKPRPKLKGIPVGKSFETIADEMGKMKVKPKRKVPGQTLNQAYASRNKKRYKGVAK